MLVLYEELFSYILFPLKSAISIWLLLSYLAGQKFKKSSYLEERVTFFFSLTISLTMKIKISKLK